MIELLAHQDLLIAVAPMAGMGFLVGVIGLFFVWRNRQKAERSQGQVAAKKTIGTTSGGSKTAHA